jgi:hypothetical protein
MEAQIAGIDSRLSSDNNRWRFAIFRAAVVLVPPAEHNAKCILGFRFCVSLASICPGGHSVRRVTLFHFARESERFLESGANRHAATSTCAVKGSVKGSVLEL